MREERDPVEEAIVNFISQGIDKGLIISFLKFIVSSIDYEWRTAEFFDFILEHLERQNLNSLREFFSKAE